MWANRKSSSAAREQSRLLRSQSSCFPEALRARRHPSANGAPFSFSPPTDPPCQRANAHWHPFAESPWGNVQARGPLGVERWFHLRAVRSPTEPLQMGLRPRGSSSSSISSRVRGWRRATAWSWPPSGTTQCFALAPCSPGKQESHPRPSVLLSTQLWREQKNGQGWARRSIAVATQNDVGSKWEVCVVHQGACSTSPTSPHSYATEGHSNLPCRIPTGSQYPQGEREPNSRDPSSGHGSSLRAGSARPSNAKTDRGAANQTLPAWNWLLVCFLTWPSQHIPTFLYARRNLIPSLPPVNRRCPEWLWR